ncbi:MAG: heparinase II/III family protein, partial [Porticoccus sp.]|nr:heparinase II/III family protein [Porticoccus sp.]
MDRFLRLRWLLGTLWRLGFTNLGRVALYRIQLKTGRLQKKLPIGRHIRGPFFSGKCLSIFSGVNNLSTISPDALLLTHGKIRYFSSSVENVGNPPNWHLDAITGEYYPNIEKHWSQLSDFKTGDIKHIWEPSRFQWLVLATQAFRTTGDSMYLSLINEWLTDWSKKNPVNQGPNWKCGQETAIRILNLLMAAFVLGEHYRPTLALIQVVREHCERIEPTLHYAIAQDNNHGTSEAAGLYVGGNWLIAVGDSSKKSRLWARMGRKRLEERISTLVENDGSFSQYSVNYHRLLLDTLSQVEFWRRNLDLPHFSKHFYKRVSAATKWLWQMTDPVTGEAPNLGANDGALLLQLADTPYRDFRPTVQLSGVLFLGQRLYENCGSGDRLLQWLDLPPEKYPVNKKVRGSVIMNNGGFVTMHGESCWGMLRFPRFHFRPGHADLLHIEIMDRGISIVKDGGSYSYNTKPQWLNYFPGVASHNTIQFDDGEPMPRLSRFLFGAWPEVKNVAFEHTDEIASWSGGYKDYRGCKHDRKVEVSGRAWKVEDVVAGFCEKAVLRWRLALG